MSKGTPKNPQFHNKLDSGHKRYYNRYLNWRVGRGRAWSCVEPRSLHGAATAKQDHTYPSSKALHVADRLQPQLTASQERAGLPFLWYWGASDLYAPLSANPSQNCLPGCSPRRVYTAQLPLPPLNVLPTAWEQFGLLSTATTQSWGARGQSCGLSPNFLGFKHTTLRGIELRSVARAWADEEPPLLGHREEWGAGLCASVGARHPSLCKIGPGRV